MLARGVGVTHGAAARASRRGPAPGRTVPVIAEKPDAIRQGRWAIMKRFLLLLALILFVPFAAQPQPAPGGPPAVGVVRAERQQITQTDEFIGRIQAVGRVALVARVTAFLEKRAFVEGAEVKQGDLLYLLEQPPFKAQVDADVANVAQLRQAQINLNYTEIHAPIGGKISTTAVTEGNVVSPTSGTLANLVSQDPMYVIFQISQRTALDLRDRYSKIGGYRAVVIRLRLPTGKIYPQVGHLDYASPTVAENTDTVTLRGMIPNPVLPGLEAGDPASRELADGEFVTVLLEGVQPIFVLAIPRAAVLSDQQGDYVYVVDAHNKAQQRRIQLGQSTPSTAVVTSGLTEGELVISEGLQDVRDGEPVSAGPASPPPVISPDVAPGSASGPSSSEPKAKP